MGGGAVWQAERLPRPGLWPGLAALRAANGAPAPLPCLSLKQLIALNITPARLYAEIMSCHFL